jgi:hypothetical protein
MYLLTFHDTYTPTHMAPAHHTQTGGLIGGLAFPSRTSALVSGRPALLPSLLAALCALLLGCLVLRRLNRELAAVGVRGRVVRWAESCWIIF